MRAETPTVTAVPGPPVLLLSGFDLAPLGYSTEEFFVSGTASSYTLAGAPTPDGHWQATAGETAPYVTRIVVVRPTDAHKFNGTVVVEWLNVSAGTDSSPDWNAAHREIMRGGYAYVGVSAQKVGVDGGPSMGAGNAMAQPLKKANPQRYGALNHPGDAFSYDIYSQAGNLLRKPKASGVLGSLNPKRIIAVGESQSAVYLTTYVNAVDPLAKVYDGFLIHSRFGAPSRLDGASMMGSSPRPQPTRLRTDLRVPVLTVITETDLIGGGLAGFYSARQPDYQHLRVWEVPGTAHADMYTFMVGFMDSGSTPLDKLAAAWQPTDKILGMQLAKPINSGPQHHYVVEGALFNLDRWIKTGHAPSGASPMQVSASADQPPALVPDANGNTQGGVRTPWVDVPTARLSGIGNSPGPLAGLAGVTEPFDAATLDRLYPGGKSEYLKKFQVSLDAAINAGFVLAADRQEILDLAAIAYHGAH
ncbi:MAG: alpha/beta hydrolase domain-containing protein [Steroidobacteraceae bacterium]